VNLAQDTTVSLDSLNRKIESAAIESSNFILLAARQDIEIMYASGRSMCVYVCKVR